MITGSKEYDVYVLKEYRGFWRWIFFWMKPIYSIVSVHSFASADEAAKNAELRTNSTPGRAIGIAADALVCCKEEALRVG